ncbi:hypothetical protein RB195_026141 [Necator americanus]|uniref:Uncharacterized protein n=1 Tax=Necator americanus TaxID=51031 RepID=A0ABR1EVR3_NECAM
MSNEPDIDPGGPLDGDELFVEQVDPSTSVEVVGQPSVGIPHYMVAEDSVWVQPLSDIIYQEDIATSFEDIQYEGLETVNQQILSTGEEVYLMPDEERDFNELTESVESLQVAAHEVVVDEMMQPQVEPTEYAHSLPRQVVRGMPTYVRTIPQHAVRPAPSQIVTMPGTNRVRYIVQQTPQAYEVPQNQHVQYEMRPKAMFEGPSNQAVIPVQRPVPTVRSRSKSQPRRPLFGDLEDDSLAYLVQEYDEGEWDGVELEDHEYFVGERAAIMAEEDEVGSSNVPAVKMQQRPYFPPNLSPTEKKEYLFVNYKKACERYFPFANVAMLEADTIYKPVEAFASDLYRFHSRGAHIHGFFRTVIDTRDPPSHDQTRYIQDIQFGKVFPLFPDYEEWDDKMRDEFRQLTSRLLRVFERKYFYANAGIGHGQAPVVKRGPKPQPKPPPDYAEQQKIGAKNPIPKGFQAVRATTNQSRIGTTKPISQATVISQPIAAATRLTPLTGLPSMSEPVAVPDEVGAARVDAFEHNKRADVKRIVNDAFAAREQGSSHYIEYEAEPSDPRTFMCRAPPGPSKTVRHQRSMGSKAMRMIHNRTIEPTIDPVSGRYVVSLDEIRSQPHVPTAAELARYVPRPVHTLREMADSARRGGYTTQAIVRPQGARVSRIDQAPRFSYNAGSSIAASQPHHLSNNSAIGRAPILRSIAGSTIASSTEVPTGNAVPFQGSVSRNEHVYPRSHSSGRNAQPPVSSYRRSASSGRPAETSLASTVTSRPKDFDAEPYIDVDDESEFTEVPSADNQVTITDNLASSKPRDRSEPALMAVSSQPRAHESDQNTAPANASTISSSTSDGRNQKRTVVLRDEKGRLRRGIKLPDGTILLRVIDDKMGPEPKPREPTAGGVYAMHSMGRKDDKKVVRRVDQQWKRIQAPVTPWTHPSEEFMSADAHAADSLPSNKNRNRRKDLIQTEDDDDIVLITETRQSRSTKKSENSSKKRGRRSKIELESEGVTAPRSRSQRRPKYLTRHCPVSEAVPHRAVSLSEEKRQTFLRNRLLKQEEEDAENIFIDVVSVDSSIEDSVRDLIASVPPPSQGSNDFHGLQEGNDLHNHDANDLSRERKKAGRPHKKFRGRLAKQKQAIRDAEIAEKVAIKHRELPVLDLALKVIDDPSVELPVEAPIVSLVLDPTIAIDAALLHEVGEVLKEVVAKVSLEELEPRRDVKSRSRRNWDYLPERVRSKRQEYKNLNVPVSERSPPPPPLKSKPRGRNSEKYRKAAALAEYPPSGSAANEASHPEVASALPTQHILEDFSILESSAPDIVSFFESDHGPQPKSVPQVSNDADQGLSLEHDSELQLSNILQSKDDLVTPVSEESVNDEDLVDVNVDNFFSDAFTTSTSGDEEETPSQKLQKWQKCINDVTLPTPNTSPTKVKRLAVDKSCEEVEQTSVSFNTFASTSVSFGFDNLSVSARELGVENVAAMVEEDLAIQDRRVSAIEKELIADALLFEAQRQAQQSSSSQSFAAPVVEGDRLDIAADVNMDFSPPSNKQNERESLASHILYINSVETTALDAHWEENSIEEIFEMSGKGEFEKTGCTLAIIVQENATLGLVDANFSLSPVRSPSDGLQMEDSAELGEHRECTITLLEPPVVIYEKYLLACSARDYALEKSGQDDSASTSVCISIPHEEAREFSTVDVHHSFSREEQSQESEKSFALIRTGEEIIETLSISSVTVADEDTSQTHPGDFTECGPTPLVSSLEDLEAVQPIFEAFPVSPKPIEIVQDFLESEYVTARDVVDFLIESVELELQRLLAEDAVRARTADTSLNDNVRTASCFFRRKFPDEESGVEYEVPPKRKKSVSIEISPSICFYGIGNESTNESEVLDVRLTEATPKQRTKRRGRRGRKTDKSEQQQVISSLPSQVSRDVVAAEVNCISEYLRSGDQIDAGFSSLTHLESSFYDSPDLFGFGEARVKRRSRSKKEKKPVPVRGEVITRSKARALAAASADKPRIVIRIKKSAIGAVVHRKEPDRIFGTELGFFGRKLANLIQHLKERQFQMSFLLLKEFRPRMKRSAVDNIKCVLPSDSVMFTTSRHRNHLISDFNLTMVRPRNPVVRCDADIGPLMASMNPVSPIRLSLPRAEGSLEHAVEQFEKGIGCVLEQVDNARTIIGNLRDKMHWSLHFLLDSQLFLLDVLYELWGFTARTVQIAVFSVYQTCLWEKHSELFDARMYCLLFELNASAALSCNIDTCASYLRRFEEWCRKSINCTSIYNHVHGMALSVIKLIAIPDVLKRLQQMTLWDSKARPPKTSEEVFCMDLAPFFQVGTCPFKKEDFDLEKLLNARMHLVNSPLENLVGFGAAQDNNRSDAFSFLFPSHAVVELCRKQIFNEIESFYRTHDIKSIVSLSNRDLYVLSPIARGYFVSRVTESRAQGYMRNHIMNLEKLIEKLNGAYSDLKANVEMQNQAEFNYPCGQVVFGFECGTVNVCINKPLPESVPQPSTEEIEEARRIMGNVVDNTIFHPTTINIHSDELSLKSHRMKKSVEAVKRWVASIQSTSVDEIENGDLTIIRGDEHMEVVYPSSPARVQIIDDEDDDDTEFGSCELTTRKCCDSDTITTVIAGRKIQYTVDCEQGYLKMKTMDSTVNDDSTDDLTATNTFSTASFNSFDQIETLKIIRSKETGELDWMAMIQNALEAAPPPETLPGFLLKKESADYRTLDIMKLHEHANHFVRETDEDGEFLDQRKEMREKIKPFQRVDYFERRRNARFEKINSSTPLEMPRPGPGTLDQLPAYGIWIHQVSVYAELEKKRLMALKPVDNIGRCRAARSEMIRGFSIPSKQRKRSASAVYWLGRTMREHFGEYIELGMSRLEYEKTQSGKEKSDSRGFGSDDVITDYFISRNNTPTTLVDPSELAENPYSYFRPTNLSRKRHPSPLLLESSLVKRFPEYPVFAPLGVAVDEPETLYPPMDPNLLTSDDDDDD